MTIYLYKNDRIVSIIVICLNLNMIIIIRKTIIYQKDIINNIFYYI